MGHSMRMRHRREGRGAAAVEFGLIVPIFLLLAFGIIQYGWYFYVAETASGAASNVTRRLAVGDCWEGTEAFDLAKGQAPATTAVKPIPAVVAGMDEGDLLTVTVTAEADILGFFPMPDGGTVTRTVKARLEDKTEGLACASP